MTAWLIRIDGWDPVAEESISLRAASHDDDRICHLDNAAWWPAIAELPKLAQDNFDGDFGGRIRAPSSSLRLRIEPWPLFGRYALADARIRIWSGVPGASWASWTQRLDGRLTAQPRVADGEAQVEFAVDDRWLDEPLLSSYAGTGGIEGPEALKGTIKPLMLGAPRYAAGVLVDPINIVFQLSAYGAIEGVDDALDGLARFGAPAGDFADYAALVAADIAPGDWATAKAAGLARHGAPPFDQISYFARGDTAGPNGWARLPGDIIRRVALLSGGAGRIDDASLDALSIACPWNLSLQLTTQTTARDVIQRIAASVNAVAGVSWLGKLYVVPVAIGASSMTLRADGTTLPPVEEVEQLQAGAPWWRLAIQAERTWLVHAPAAVQYTTPAEPGATVGAPSGTPLANRTADEVVASLDSAVDGIAAEVMRAATWRGESDEVIYTADGTPVRIVVEAIGSTVDEHTVFVAFLKEVAGDGSAKFLFTASADGHIVGIEGISGGGFVPQLSFVASRFLFVDDSGNNPINAMVYEGGVWKLKSMEVDTIKANVITTDKLVTRAISDGDRAEQGSPVSGVGSSTWLELVSYTLTIPAGNEYRVLAVTTGYLGFPSGDEFWEARLIMNGVVEQAGGGLKTADLITLSGFREWAAGDYEMTIEFRGHSSVSANDFGLNVLWWKK